MKPLRESETYQSIPSANRILRDNDHTRKHVDFPKPNLITSLQEKLATVSVIYSY